jgi:hypothetical protein
VRWIGEWEVIKKGYPDSPGITSPSALGLRIDNDPKVVEKWIEVA